MAQENNKIEPDFYEKRAGDKNLRRGLRFSIFCVIALFPIILIACNGSNFNEPDVQKTTEQEFMKKMLKDGDVDKIDKVTNKELVKVYIKKGSLYKEFYRERFRQPITQDPSVTPLFEFRVSDWESFNRRLSQFYKDNNIAEIPETVVSDEGEWYGPFASTLITVLLLVGLGVCVGVLPVLVVNRIRSMRVTRK